MSAKSSRPSIRPVSARPPQGGGGVTPSNELQVDIGRVLQHYRDALAQANEQAMIAQAAQEQLAEENGSLRARIAELESDAQMHEQDAAEVADQ